MTTTTCSYLSHPKTTCCAPTVGYLEVELLYAPPARFTRCHAHRGEQADLDAGATWHEGEPPMRVPLQTWIREQIVEDDMCWKVAWEGQVRFARDRLVALACAGLAFEDIESVAWVISTHRSKSITLPVYQIERPDLGLTLVLRNNFYNWKISVMSERPIVDVDFTGLFHTTPPVEPEYTGDPLHPVYFEGFPSELVFGYYKPSDKHRWSAEVRSDEAVWTTVFLILRSLDAIKPATWSTKASHAMALEAEKQRRAQWTHIHTSKDV